MSVLILRDNEEETQMTHTVFTQYINEQENQMEAELAFDASFFKANRKVNWPYPSSMFLPLQYSFSVCCPVSYLYRLWSVKNMQFWKEEKK